MRLELTARCLLAALLCCGVATSCTSSRAVRAWHQGVEAESKGNLRRARDKYGESYQRSKRHIGAELARLRLMARSPASRKKATERLNTLLTKRPDVPELMLFGGWWALLEEDIKLAKARLASLAPNPKDGNNNPLAGQVLQLKRAIAMQERRRAETFDAAALAARKNGSLAVKALNAGDHAHARDLLAAVVARDPQVHWTVEFNLGLAYLHMGHHQKARRHWQRAVKRCHRQCTPLQTNLAILGP